jgi:hypothetical protein
MSRGPVMSGHCRIVICRSCWNGVICVSGSDEKRVDTMGRRMMERPWSLTGMRRGIGAPCRKGSGEIRRQFRGENSSRRREYKLLGNGGKKSRCES